MANKRLFNSLALNEECAPAYKLPEKHQLAQYVATC
jgi:hypothetical protein